MVKNKEIAKQMFRWKRCNILRGDKTKIDDSHRKLFLRKWENDERTKTL